MFEDTISQVSKGSFVFYLFRDSEDGNVYRRPYLPSIRERFIKVGLVKGSRELEDSRGEEEGVE